MSTPGSGPAAFGGERIGKIVVALAGAKVAPVDAVGGGGDADGGAVNPIDATGVGEISAALGVIHEPLGFDGVPYYEGVAGGVEDGVVRNSGAGARCDVDERGSPHRE